MDTFRYSETNLLTLAGLWTLFGIAEAGVYGHFSVWQQTVHTPADPGRSMDRIFCEKLIVAYLCLLCWLHALCSDQN
jgi:hypothetical protein